MCVCVLIFLFVSKSISLTKEMYLFVQYVHLIVADRLEHDVQSIGHRWLSIDYLVARIQITTISQHLKIKRSTYIIKNTKTR